MRWHRRPPREQWGAEGSRRGVNGPLRAIPLRVWLVMLVVAVAGVGLLGSSVAVSAVMRGYSLEKVDEDLDSVLRSFTAPSSALSSDGGAIRRVPLDFYVQVIYPDGTPAGENSWLESFPDVSSLTVDAGPQTVPATADSASNQRWRAKAVNQDGVVVVLAKSLAKEETQIGRLTAVQTIISLTVLVVLALVAHYLVYRSLTPLREVERTAGDIAEGNLEYMLPDKDDGEIGELYRNYEDMRLRLKESTDEKILAEKQNKELVSNISHDLKTPITAIKGYVEGIMDGVADTPEKMDKYIRTIYNKAMDMDRLINELTVYSGIDSNRIPYHFHKINISEYFGDCIEEVGLDLESKNIALDYSNLVAPETLIIADPEQLKRVINNIIGNSIKYLDKPKGQIDIRILDELDSIRVEIEDNGKGIAAKDLPKIFERFYRTDTSRNSAQGGSGIGLSIVKKIIEDHGGYIWATSKEGEGTCMHFVIRKYQEAE